MKIDSVDFYYLSMPEILDVGDGSQDALLVRVRAGDYEGWGECEASPLPTIAAFYAPMSHSACRPVADSVLGQTLQGVDDIRRINALARERSFDLLQSAHVISGIDIALWDLLGKSLSVPVYSLLGYDRAVRKTPYASVLFGDTPELTYRTGRALSTDGYTAVKFGWNDFGRGSVARDRDQLAAAREAVGDGILMVDAGMAWVADATEALARAAHLAEFNVFFLEEPFVPGADSAYRALSRRLSGVRVAGGEGSSNEYQAIGMMDNAWVDIVQVDAGRIGGITPAFNVAQAALARSKIYINHTFTSPLALSASLQSYAGISQFELCEYPVESRPVSRGIALEQIERDVDGYVRVPEAPGLGVTVDMEHVHRYALDVEIRIGRKTLYRSGARAAMAGA